MDIRVILAAVPKVDEDGVYTGDQDRNVSYMYCRHAAAVGTHKDVNVKTQELAVPAKAIVNPYIKFGRKVLNDKLIVALRDPVE
jgi:hypothetical protein